MEILTLKLFLKVSNAGTHKIKEPDQWQYTADNEWEEFDNMIIRELTEAMNAFKIDTQTHADIWCIMSTTFDLGNIQFILKEIKGL